MRLAWWRARVGATARGRVWGAPQCSTSHHGSVLHWGWLTGAQMGLWSPREGGTTRLAWWRTHIGAITRGRVWVHPGANRAAVAQFCPGVASGGPNGLEGS